MWQLIQEHFLDPILANGWFNPINTAVYSIILIVAVFLVYRLLNCMKVRIDNRFALAILPFIFWASTTRVLHDAAYAGRLSPALNQFYSSPFFPTPGSYIITFILALFTLLLSLLIQRAVRIPYWKSMLTIGTALTLFNLTMLPVVTPLPLYIIGGLALLWAALFFSWRIILPRLPRLPISNYYHTLLSRENLAILSAHFLDATATVTALTLFGYLEQHVVPRLLFPYLGPYAMFLLKIMVVLPALWAIDRYADDPQFRKFLKIVILILGLAPGLRDMLRLAALV
jgi:uncharacterized membrane protein